MTRNRMIQLLAVGIAILALILSSLLAQPIDRHRAEMKITGKELDNSAPPEIVLATAALGAFRGLAVDYFWYRATQLQQEGKFYEADANARAITTLQPRFGEVWRFQAWNMAYNISVETHTPDERWSWVSKGINLLREKGIPLNQDNIHLYRELSWIFMHKIGGYTDDQHWHYKRKLAHQWQQLLGTPTEGRTAQQIVDAFRLIAEAPDSIEQLIAAHPAVGPLLKMIDELGFDPDFNLLMHIGGLQLYKSIWRHTGNKTILLASAIRELRTYDPKLIPLITDPEQWLALEMLLNYLRKDALRNRYHMDPQFMFELMDGRKLTPDDPVRMPLDWRHPAAHALYWGAYGVDRVVNFLGEKNIEQLNTDRQVIHSLQQLMHVGRISYDPAEDLIDMIPDPSFVAVYDKVVENLIERASAPEFRTGAIKPYKTGHANFLMMAAVFYYLYGEESQAKFYYDKGKSLYGWDEEKNMFKPRYARPFKQTMYEEWLTNVGVQQAGKRQTIDMLIVRAFKDGLLNNRMQVYERFMGLAKVVYDDIQAQAEQAPSAEDKRLGFVGSFQKLLGESYVKFMQHPQQQLLQLTRIWRNTSTMLVQQVNDRLRPTFELYCQQVDADPLIAFPEPPGMVEFRRQRDATQTPKPKSKIETIERQ